MNGRHRAGIFLAIMMCCFPAACTPQHRHALVHREAKEATCTECGWIEHWECGECGALFFDEGGTPAEDVKIEALGHNVVEGIVVKATCEEAGEASLFCLRCQSEISREEIPATGHLYLSYMTTEKATCTSKGEMTRICSVCSKTEKIETPFAAHSWTEDNVCAVCGLVCPETEGLVFTLTEDGSGYTVSAGEDFSATEVAVPCYHEGLPVVGIDADAFRGCYAITEIDLYAEVLLIGENAFRGCGSLREIALPDSLKEIGAYAFYSCSSLTSISVGRETERIGTSAFYGCCKAEKIFVDMENEWFYAAGNCLVERAAQRLILGGKGAEIPEEIVEIGDNAFLYNEGVTELTLPGGLERIGSAAFYGCSNLKLIRFGGTTAEWNALPKGDGWKGDAALTVLCSDGEVSE